MSGGDTESGNHQNGKTDNDQNGKTGGITSETKVDGESAKDSRERRLIEGAVVCTVIAVVWGLLTLPVIFYYLPQEAVGLQSSSLIAGTNCTPEVYTGVVCREALLAQQFCLTGENTDVILIPESDDQQHLEEKASFLISGLNLLPGDLPSPQCLEVADRFACFNIFGLCGNSSGEVFLPSAEDCKMVTEELCGAELQRGMDFIPASSLPSCHQGLPDTAMNCSTVSSNGNIPTSLANNSIQNDMALICNDGLFDAGGFCSPECGEWEEFSHGTIVTIDVFMIMQIVVYFISGTVVLVLSVLRRKQMFKFPSIFIVYGTISLGVYEFFLLIGFFDTKKLFCSSPELQESIEDETVFCTIQGMVQTYFSLLQVIFFVYHVTAIYWTIKFPLTARHIQTNKNFRYFHIGIVLAALLVCWIPVIVALGTSGYTIPRFPPLMCVARDPNATFYGLILPKCILLAFGIALIVLTLQILIKLIHEMGVLRMTAAEGQSRLKSAVQSRFHITTAELKVLIIFVYSVIIATLSLVTFTIGTRNAPQFIVDISIYFACEALGIQPGREPCERAFERLGQEILLDISLALVGLYPVVNLVYVVNIEDLKQMCTVWRKKMKLSTTTS